MVICCLGITLRYRDLCEPAATPGYDIPPPAVYASSPRDGPPGLRNLTRASLAGHYCATTADGPRGPALVAKPGVAQLAQLVNTNVSTCYVHPHRAWQLRSWDRFLIPKPFSRVTVAWTRPVPPDLPSVQAALDRSVELAQLVKK